MSFKFNLKYFVVAVILFFVEVLIALYAHDQFIRPIIGDVLVVILIYSLISAFFKVDPVKTALWVLLFSCVVELLQYFHFVELIGLNNYQFFNIIIGNSFSWLDLFAYAIGTGIVLLAERILHPTIK